MKLIRRMWMHLRRAGQYLAERPESPDIRRSTEQNLIGVRKRAYLYTLFVGSVASVGGFIIGVAFQPLIERLPKPVPLRSYLAAIVAGLACIAWAAYRNYLGRDPIRRLWTGSVWVVFLVASIGPLWYAIDGYLKTPAPLVSGLLVPASNERRHAGCGTDYDETAVIVGRTVLTVRKFPWEAVSYVSETPEGELADVEEPVLILDRDEDGALLLTAMVRSADGSLVARLHNNQLVASPNAFIDWINGNSELLVRDAGYEIVLSVQYLTPNLVRIIGTFRRPGFPTIEITDKEVNIHFEKDPLRKDDDEVSLALGGNCYSSGTGLLVSQYGFMGM